MFSFTFLPLPITQSSNSRNAWRIIGGMADLCLFAAHHRWRKFPLSARFIQRRWGVGQNAAERVIDELVRRWDITITQCLYVGRWTRHLLFARPSRHAVPVPNELLHAIPLGHCSVCVSEQQRQCDDCQPGKEFRLQMLAALVTIYREAYRNPNLERNKSRIPVVSFDEPVRAAGAAVVELMQGLGFLDDDG
ncbi:MAG: hypothetical protein GY807_17825, partial [Gammaproteobacteria bacterium]|nr:hypothetical protein [Gammaproteobacteria bacterium]